MSSITKNRTQPQATAATTSNGATPPNGDSSIADEAGNCAIIRTLIEHPKTATALLNRVEESDFTDHSQRAIIAAAKWCITNKIEPTYAQIEEGIRIELEKATARDKRHFIAALTLIAELQNEEYTDEIIRCTRERIAKIEAAWTKENAISEPEKAKFEFGFTTDSDLDDRLGEIEWLWPGYIPRGFVTAAVGDQDVGKSQVAQSLCDIVIRGNRWPDGQPHEPHPDTKLLWIDTEGSIALLHQRMKRWGMKRGCFILPPDPLQELTVDDELHWMWIEAAIEKFQPPLVVIDALSGAHKSGKENGNDEMKPVMKKLAGLAQKYNIAVVVVHHLNKPIAGVSPYPITIHRLRGASAIPQYCRSILALGTPDLNQPTKRRMDVIKLNLAKKPEPVGYELSDSGPLWGDAPEPPKERRAIDDALDFLEIALQGGPRLSEDVQEEAKAQKIGSNALRDAMKMMKVKSRREGGKDGRWFWHPTTETQKDGQG